MRIRTVTYADLASLTVKRGQEVPCGEVTGTVEQGTEQSNIEGSSGAVRGRQFGHKSSNSLKGDGATTVPTSVRRDSVSHDFTA